ncbi:YIP1 family protein [Acholeplasma vituli]|uniref:YIP1 family protein n=1 Tax=Paracholeplasma vituli TaxID=69473 RepID=A0ABT2PW57_9MOLU|nr:YIP1 family protein [Paracholeplasma vituli]MCU0105179.1 YIP1 family protein [Paracholeplasma vituli]
MKKLFMLSILVLSLGLIVKSPIQSSQSSSGIPYNTYTLGEYNRLVQTQTAYIPVGAFSNLSLNNPQDIYQKDDILYIADTGNKRVLKVALNGSVLDTYSSTEWITPTGIFIEEQKMYIADKDARTIFVFDLTTKQIISRITKPTSPIFGQNNAFLPIKVVVGSNDAIYVVGEGSTSGIIQLNYAGEFVGYLGINSVSISFRKFLYNLFVKQSDLASSLPPSPTNVALGQKGSILTTNINFGQSFKRLNISGVNTLLGDTRYPTEPLSDIWMDQDNYIYLVSSTGEIYEYDANGRLLFQFNTKDRSMKQGLGLTNTPAGITTDSNGNLYILDRIYNNIQIYQRTVFVDLVHEAVTLYNDGRYLESKPLWEEILRQNTGFALAHSALGEALAKEGNFDDALDSFYEAKDLSGYSNAYWEIRNVAIQNNLVTWIIILISIIVVFKVGKKTVVYLPFYESAKSRVHKISEVELVSQIRLSKQIFKKPADLVYYVKRDNRGSYLSGLLVFVAFLVVYLLDTYLSGFLFRNHSVGNVLQQVGIVSIVFFLFVTVNYLVSTFSDGEGRFKDVFVMSAYALVPFILFIPIMTVVSHFLTYNEAFIYTFYHQIVLYYTVFLFVYTLKEVHNYTLFETIKSILLILFGMLIMVLMGLLIYAFIGQVWDFIVSIIKEVIYRA